MCRVYTGRRRGVHDLAGSSSENRGLGTRLTDSFQPQNDSLSTTLPCEDMAREIDNTFILKG